MPVKITVTAPDGAVSFEKVLLSDVVILGRDKGCDIPLEDEQRTLSRQHLRLENQGSSLRITVLSKVNPVVVQGQELGPEESMTAPADTDIEMHPFRVRAEVVAQHQVDQVPQVPQVPQVRRITPPEEGNSGWFDIPAQDAVSLPSFPGALRLGQHIPPQPRDRQAAMMNEHPFADFIAAPRLAQSPVPFGSPVGELSKAAEFSGQGKPFYDRCSTAGAEGVESRTAGSASPPALFKYVTSSIDHVHDFNLPFTPPPLPIVPALQGTDLQYGSAVSLQPEAMPATIGEVSPFIDRQPPSVPSVPSERPEPTHLLPTKEESFGGDASVFTEGAAAAARAPSLHTDQHALLQAFYAGLNIPMPRNLEDPEAQMRDAGEMLREAVNGIVSLLIARAEIKKQIRTEERTVLAPRDNNPLKMMDNPQDALSYLCDPGRQLRGAFLPPVKAVADACADLQRHNLGLIAGTHAAIRSALQLLTPEAIENKAGSDNVFQRLNRRARLWELFIAEHEQIKCNQNDIAERIIETDFSRAYSSYVETDE